MSMRFMDGFDHYATASLTEKWTAITIISGTPICSSGNGRRGGQSLRVTGGGIGHVTKTLDNQASWVIGFGLRTNALPNPCPVLGVLDAGSVQCDLRLNADGTLSVTRNGTAVTGGTSTNSLSTNTYYFVEYKVTISASISASSWKVRVNGVDWITVATGQSSKATASTTANGIRIGLLANPSVTTTLDYDDLYVLDGVDSGVTGLPNNDFIGDVAVVPLYPASAGSNSAWTPDAGSNYSRVSELLADGDSSYVQTSGVGNIDSYIYQNLAGSPATVFGIGWCPEVRKTDASVYNVRRYLRAGGTPYVGSVDYSLSTTYAMYQEILQGNPANANAPFTAADLQGSEWGVKLNSIV